MIIRSILELALIVFTVICVAKEDKIAAWERKAFAAVRKAAKK